MLSLLNKAEYSYLADLEEAAVTMHSVLSVGVCIHQVWITSHLPAVEPERQSVALSCARACVASP
jgi:hypothetical protein